MNYDELTAALERVCAFAESRSWSERGSFSDPSGDAYQKQADDIAILRAHLKRYGERPLWRVLVYCPFEDDVLPAYFETEEEANSFYEYADMMRDNPTRPKRIDDVREYLLKYVEGYTPTRLSLYRKDKSS